MATDRVRQKIVEWNHRAEPAVIIDRVMQFMMEWNGQGNGTSLTALETELAEMLNVPYENGHYNWGKRRNELAGD